MRSGTSRTSEALGVAIALLLTPDVRCSLRETCSCGAGQRLAQSVIIDAFDGALDGFGKWNWRCYAAVNEASRERTKFFDLADEDSKLADFESSCGETFEDVGLQQGEFLSPDGGGDTDDKSSVRVEAFGSGSVGDADADEAFPFVGWERGGVGATGADFGGELGEDGADADGAGIDLSAAGFSLLGGIREPARQRGFWCGTTFHAGHGARNV